MSAAGIGWKFPANNGGSIDGYNHPGIAHFKGAPVSSLAREVIQNSLDARKDKNQPVHVSFEVLNLNADDYGRDELLSAVRSCQKDNSNNENANVADELEVAINALSGNSISCLRVSDRNTTGLLKDNWETLVKKQGDSIKHGEKGAGGSHGLGKYATFAISSVRTVFYWTRYFADGELVERLQGKSVLMSHNNQSTQGIGFYGERNGCQAIEGEYISDSFRLLNNTAPISGTAIYILGQKMQDSEWRKKVVSSVLENYFYAIENNLLTVKIEPEGNEDIVMITRDNLQYWFDKYSPDDNDNEDDTSAKLSNIRKLWEITSEKCNSIIHQFEKQDTDLGHCRLWVAVDEDLPSRVGLVRRTGMLITDQQMGLVRFPGYRDFAALCYFEDPDGNELLRSMENPRHDQFEVDWLPDKTKEKGRRALNRVVKWIREQIKSVAYTSTIGQHTVLSELAGLLPDYYPDEDFEFSSQSDEDKGEPGFAEKISISLKPIRQSSSSIHSNTNEEHEDIDGDGEEFGERGGQGSGKGGGNGNRNRHGNEEGEGSDGKGSRGGGKGKKLIRISRVRILPSPGQDNCRRISFVSEGSGVAQICIDEAGDSAVFPREDIRSVGTNSLKCLQLKAGEKQTIEIEADQPLEGCALRLIAYESDMP